MKTATLMLTLALAVAPPAYAASVLANGTVPALDNKAGLALAQSRNCMGCHALSEHKLGPSFDEVAARYRGKDGAEDKLVQKMMIGGAGDWGHISMPASTKVSDDEAHQLARWVLARHR